MKLTSDWLQNPDTIAVMKALQAKNNQVFFVGGCVRNGLLGVSTADIDISTDARPEQIIALAKIAGLKFIPTGICADHLARRSRLYSPNSRNGINDPHGVRTDPPHGGHIVGAEHLDRYAKWPLSSTGSNRLIAILDNFWLLIANSRTFFFVI